MKRHTRSRSCLQNVLLSEFLGSGENDDIDVPTFVLSRLTISFEFAQFRGF